MTDFKPVVRVIVQAVLRKYLHPKVLLKKFGPKILRKLINPRKLLRKWAPRILQKIFNPRKMLKYFGRKLLREKIVPKLTNQIIERLVSVIIAEVGAQAAVAES